MVFRRYLGNFAGGASSSLPSSPRAKNSALSVASTSGPLVTLSLSGILLKRPVTFSKVSGNANLTVNATSGAVSATAPIPEGVTQTLVVKLAGVDGAYILWNLSFLALTGGANAGGATLTQAISFALGSASAAATGSTSLFGTALTQAMVFAPGIASAASASVSGTALAQAMGLTAGGASAAGTTSIVSMRGTQTKAGFGGVDLGALITPGATATASSLTLISGTAGHWTTPPNGKHPTPISTGVISGSYAFSGTVTVSGVAVTCSLTINTESSITVPAQGWYQGRNVIPAYTFTKVATVSSASELGSYTTAAALDDLAMTVAKGSAPFSTSSFTRSPSALKRTLVTSEDRTAGKWSTCSKITASSQQRWTFWKLKSSNTGSAGIHLIDDVGSTDCHYLDLDVSSPIGTAPSSFATTGLRAAGSTNPRFINIKIARVNQGFSPTSGTGIVAKDFEISEITQDDVYLGGASSGDLTDFHMENVLSGSNTFESKPKHADSGQIATAASGTGYARFAGTTRIINWRHRLFDGSNPAQGPFSAFSGQPPTISGVVEMYALGYNDLAANGSFVFNTRGGGVGVSSIDQTAQTSFNIFSFENSRAINGLLGSSGSPAGNVASASGPQGKIAFDDAWNYFPGNETMFPTVGFSASTPPTFTIHNGYNQGPSPPSGALVNLTDNGVYWRNRTPSATIPNYSNPSTIDAGLNLLFDNPYEVTDWSTYPDMASKEAHYNTLYAPKAAGPLDRGDGRWNHYLCGRRAGAAAKWNHYGLATLAVAAVGGTVTVTLSAILDCNVICDINRNGTVVGSALTIAAGTITASATYTMTAGDTFLATNDVGLLNATTVAS